jgi:hypothetical protein
MKTTANVATGGGLIASASDALADAAVAVRLRGDRDEYDRLLELQRKVDAEIDYVSNLVDREMPAVEHRSVPPGATLGWLYVFDARTREARRQLGVWLPEETGS